MFSCVKFLWPSGLVRGAPDQTENDHTEEYSEDTMYSMNTPPPGTCDGTWTSHPAQDDCHPVSTSSCR